MDRVVTISAIGLLVKWFSESQDAQVLSGIALSVLFPGHVLSLLARNRLGLGADPAGWACFHDDQQSGTAPALLAADDWLVCLE